MAYESVTSPKINDRVIVKWLREEDEQFEGFVQVWAGSQDQSSEKHGWWVDLDRAGVNQLIKNLRRARNVAFGSDE